MGTSQVRSILALAEFVRSDARTPPIGPQQLQFTATLHCDPDRLLLRTVHDAQHGSAHFTGQALLDGEPVQADLTTRIDLGLDRNLLGHRGDDDASACPGSGHASCEIAFWWWHSHKH